MLRPCSQPFYNQQYPWSCAGLHLPEVQGLQLAPASRPAEESETSIPEHFEKHKHTLQNKVKDPSLKWQSLIYMLIPIKDLQKHMNVLWDVCSWDLQLLCHTSVH